MASLNEKLASLLEVGGASHRIKGNSLVASSIDLGVDHTGISNNALLELTSGGNTIDDWEDSYVHGPQQTGYHAGVQIFTTNWNPGLGIDFAIRDSEGYSGDTNNWGVYRWESHIPLVYKAPFQNIGTNWMTAGHFSQDQHITFTVMTPKASLKGYVAGADVTGLSDQTFLDNAVNGIKDSAPLAFDTLGEIASALPTNENASAFINLNTGTRVHTFTGDGITTNYAVSHKSGNIDVFVDGVLQVPQLSDSASGATTLISSHEYFSNDGSTQSVTQYAVDHTQESAIPSGTELVRWIGNWGGEWGVRNYYNKTVVLMNGSRITEAGVTLDPSYNDPTYGPWFGFTAHTGWPASGFYRQQWGANITGGYTTDSVEYAYQMSTTSVNVPAKIETSGTSCSSVVFVDAPQSGQVVTVKTY